MTNHPPSVLWHCWFGHQTYKNRWPYNLYCVGADVKPCSISQCTANFGSGHVCRCTSTGTVKLASLLKVSGILLL